MAPPPSAYFHVGQRLTDYAGVDVSVERAAHGGFGAVAMGPDQAAGKWRALKILHPDVLAGADETTQQRLQSLFLREALTWKGLWPHPNVLTAQFVTVIDAQFMLVLDYAEEGSLRDRFVDMRQRRQWFTLASALRLAQHIAAGLVALHTPDPDLLRPKPIVHRDLKPENILLSHGFAKITDFGLAKAVALAIAPSISTSESDPTSTVTLTTDTDLSSTNPSPSNSSPVNGQRTQAYHTRRGAALGTPAYMAPEQWHDASLADTPADAYAFGIILAELFTGHHPLLDLERFHPQDVWRQAHLAGQPIPLRQLGAEMFATQQEQPGLEVALMQLESLVVRLLAKDPTGRLSLAAALAALQAAAQTLGQQPYTPPETYPHTTEHASIIWQGWADTYGRFSMPAEALPRIERALALTPHDPSVLSSYGDILAGVGRLEEAEAVYRQALIALPASDRRGRKIVFNQLGNLLSDAGRFAAAEEIYATEVALQPDAADAWYNRADNERHWALAEAEAGHPAETRAHVEQGLTFAERAVALNPNDSDFSRQARVLRQMRDAL